MRDLTPQQPVVLFSTAGNSGDNVEAHGRALRALKAEGVAFKELVFHPGGNEEPVLYVLVKDEAAREAILCCSFNPAYTIQLDWQRVASNIRDNRQNILGTLRHRQRSQIAAEDSYFQDPLNNSCFVIEK
jgi:hypothetical protein